MAADVIERCERDAQIHTILSDKTGTLTQNKMELFKVGLNADMKYCNYSLTHVITVKRETLT